MTTYQGVDAADQSALNNDGAYHGACRCAPSLLPTSTDRAVKLDGTSSFINIGNTRAEITATTFAFGAWVRLISDAEPQPALLGVNNVQSTPSNRYIVQATISGDTVKWEINTSTSGGANQLTTEPNGHTLGDTVFVVANLGRSAQKLYTNGSLVASSTYTGQAVAAGDRISIGQEFDGADTNYSQFLHGVVDEAFMLNRAITDAEVADLYSAGTSSGGYDSAVMALSNLIGYWRLNEFTNCAAPVVGFVGWR